MPLFDKFIKKGVSFDSKPQKLKEPEPLPVLDMPVDIEPAPQPQEEAISILYNLGGSSLSNRNILVIAPNTNGDITQIVQNLQRGEACVANLENMPLTTAQRRLDFLSGVICAIGGTIKAIDAQKYILTPQGLGVKAQG